jgi:protease-4
MANVAASGGYWVSTPADRLFAEPSTITGSIGIFAVVPSFERALGDWGVTSDGVKTTPLSGQPDLLGGLSPAVSGMIQANIEHGYARFLSLVATSRKKTPEQIDALAQGRVWDGGTARQNGLVDQFGGLDAALEYVAQQAKLKAGEWHPVYLGQTEDGVRMLLEGLAGDEDSQGAAGAADMAGLIARRQQALAGRVLADARMLAGTSGAQALCLECRARTAALPAPAVPATAELGLLALLQRLGVPF